jgi:hypothetical protein
LPRGITECPLNKPPRRAILRHRRDLTEPAIAEPQLGYVALNFLPDTCPERILTATDRREKLVLLTTDRKLLEYPHLQARW